MRMIRFPVNELRKAQWKPRAVTRQDRYIQQQFNEISVNRQGYLAAQSDRLLPAKQPDEIGTSSIRTGSAFASEYKQAQDGGTRTGTNQTSTSTGTTGKTRTTRTQRNQQTSSSRNSGSKTGSTGDSGSKTGSNTSDGGTYTPSGGGSTSGPIVPF